MCHNLTCDFTYTESVGEVTAFTFDLATKKLILTGSSFPIQITDIRSITFAMTNCLVDQATLTATNLECTLEHEPTCGDYMPVLVSSLGLITNAASLAVSTVQCSVASAAPLTNLNLLGGDTITITGTNFPRYLSTSTFLIKFDDAQTTNCIAQSSTSTTLSCLTSAFDKVASSGATLNFAITING